MNITTKKRNIIIATITIVIVNLFTLFIQGGLDTYKVSIISETSLMTEDDIYDAIWKRTGSCFSYKVFSPPTLIANNVYHVNSEAEKQKGNTLKVYTDSISSWNFAGDYCFSLFYKYSYSDACLAYTSSDRKRVCLKIKGICSPKSIAKVIEEVGIKKAQQEQRARFINAL